MKENDHEIASVHFKIDARILKRMDTLCKERSLKRTDWLLETINEKLYQETFYNKNKSLGL